MSSNGRSESIERLRAELSGEGLEGVLVVAKSSADSDLAPFVGDAHLGECFVIAPSGGEPTLGYLVDMEREEAASTGLDLLTPQRLGFDELRELEASPGELWRQLLSRAFERLGLPAGRWGVAGHPAAGTVVEACAGLAGDGWTFVSSGEALRRWRKFKPASWRGRIDGPAAGVRAAMRAVAERLRAARAGAETLELVGEPLTAGRLRAAAGRAMAAYGLVEPEGNIFAAGAAGGVPHNRGDSDHALRVGEPLVVDLFPKGRLFADCTRTFCVGRPPAGFEAAFETVHRALESAHASCRPGIRGWDLQAATCDAFEAEGYATPRSEPGARRGYVHQLGHGVGFELHEYPSFREAAGAEGSIELGDLLTLEPGLYDPEAGWGVRLEDLCYVEADGPALLTPLPYDWDPAAWD